MAPMPSMVSDVAGRAQVAASGLLEQDGDLLGGPPAELVVEAALERTGRVRGAGGGGGGGGGGGAGGGGGRARAARHSPLGVLRVGEHGRHPAQRNHLVDL